MDKRNNNNNNNNENEKKEKTVFNWKQRIHNFILE